MKPSRVLAALAALPIAILLGVSQAADKTVTLSVPGMYCEMCPVTVSKALKKVNGVQEVKASFETRQAIVTFDDAKTSVEALEKATANAGYPSSLKAAK